MALGRLEVDKPRRCEFLLGLSRTDQESTFEYHDQRVLMHLMIIQPLALREGQQDHPVGVVVGTEHPRRVDVNLFGVQLPQLHPARIISTATLPDRRCWTWIVVFEPGWYSNWWMRSTGEPGKPRISNSRTR
jgi:hypothetical protein